MSLLKVGHSLLTVFGYQSILLQKNREEPRPPIMTSAHPESQEKNVHSDSQWNKEKINVLEEQGQGIFWSPAYKIKPVIYHVWGKK